MGYKAVHGILSFVYFFASASAFCETEYGGLFNGGPYEERGRYKPELGNGWSAWMITFCGLHMMLFWDDDTLFFRVLATCLTANGIGSFTYHYFGMWAAVDADTMTLAVMLASGYVMEEVAETLFFRDNEGQMSESDRRCHRCIMSVVWTVVTLAAWWIMNAAQVPDEDGRMTSYYGGGGFEISFGVPMFLSVLGIGFIVFCKDWSGNPYLTEEVMARSRKQFKFGLCMGFGCLPGYFFCEFGCHDFVVARWFPGHMLWHLCMPVGMLNLMFCAAILRADNLHRVPNIYEGRYFSVFPAFTFHEPDMHLRKPFLHAVQSITHNMSVSPGGFRLSRSREPRPTQHQDPENPRDQEKVLAPYAIGVQLADATVPTGATVPPMMRE